MGNPPPIRDPRNWQGTQARKKAGRAKSAKSRLPLVIGILFVMLALGGVLLGLLSYLRDTPKPLLVVIRVDQYTDPLLPPSPWGDQDRAALRSTGLKEQATFNSQERQLLLQELKALGQNQPKKQPLVLYLCAYAIGVENGGVALLPADARLDKPTTWLPFQDVLDALKACPVQHKLLLLDLTLPSITPRGGVLSNDVAERLQPILDVAVQVDSGLQVLTACSPGQVSFSSEELGQTVFAHYVTQGLLGYADGSLPNQPADHNVTVQELQTYVIAHVDQWAWRNRRKRQTPLFVGSDADYALVSVETPPALEAQTGGEAALPVEYPPLLQRSWKERDRWWNDRGSWTPALLYRQLEENTQRAEKRWRAGMDIDKIKMSYEPELDRLIKRRQSEKSGADAGEPQSLAQATAALGQQPPTAPSDVVAALKFLAADYIRANQPKATEDDMKKLAAATKALLDKYEGKPLDLAWAVVTVAAAEKAPQDYLRCWYGLLQPQPGGEGQAPATYNEVRFLKRLVDWKLEKPTDWPAATVAGALKMTLEAEQVEAGNPQLQPWLKTNYAEAVQKRRAAEERLFDVDPARRATAHPAISEAIARFHALGLSLDVLNSAKRQRDDGMVFLPAYAVYLEHDATKERDWEQALETTALLDDLLAQPSDGPVPQEKAQRLRELTATLSNDLKMLRQPLDSAWVKAPIGQRQTPSGVDAVEMGMLLQLPGFTMPERLMLWNNYRAVARTLNADAAGRESSSDRLPTYDSVAAVRQERDRALVRARASLALLKLLKAKPEAVNKVDAELQRARGARTEEGAWLSLSRALREAWKQYELDRASDDKN